MANDCYSSFSNLLANETQGRDYLIVVEDRQTKDLIMAPHGGRIEPGTSEIARSIAGDDKSLYLFEGVRKGLKHHEPHVTSHKYDEPQAIAIAQTSERVIAIHGRADGSDPHTTWVGGLDNRTSKRIIRHLQDAGFKCRLATTRLGGKHPGNICNRGRQRHGVQLEAPRTLRVRFRENPKQLSRFSNAIRTALA